MESGKSDVYSQRPDVQYYKYHGPALTSFGRLELQKLHADERKDVKVKFLEADNTGNLSVSEGKEKGDKKISWVTGSTDFVDHGESECHPCLATHLGRHNP